MQQTRVVNRKKETRKKARTWLIICMVALALVACSLFVAHAQNWWPFTKVNSPKTGTGERSPKNDTPATKPDIKAQDTTPQTSQQIPVDTALTASITKLEESGGNVIFSGIVTNAVSAGTCVVTFSTSYDRPVTQQFTSTYNKATATCGPVNIPATEFSYLGEWKVVFHFYSNGQQATAQSQIVIN